MVLESLRRFHEGAPLLAAKLGVTPSGSIDRASPVGRTPLRQTGKSGVWAEVYDLSFN